MIQYSAALLEAFAAEVVRPRSVVTIEAGGTTYYFTSHGDVITPAPADTVTEVIEGLSTTSQENTPEKRISTVGSLSAKFVDDSGVVSGWLRSLNDANIGIKDARIRLYIGAQGISFDDYALVATQFVDGISHDEITYNVRARDAMRFLKTKGAELQKAVLTADIDEDATTIPISTTEGLNLVEHGASYSDGSAGQTVGYVYFEREAADGYIVHEVVRYTGKTEFTLTGCTRGALNTRPHAWYAAGESTKATKVKEHVYLELPAPKLIWALATNELYGQPAATIPWGGGVSAEYLDLASFENIGLDLWNPNDDSQGLILRFDGIESIEIKAFIEKEILPLMSCGLVVAGTGELKLARSQGVVTDAPATITLDESVVSEVSDFDIDLEYITNLYAIYYNWRRDQKNFSRKHLLRDQDSIDRNGEGKKVAHYAFKGLHYTRHNLDLVRALMSGLRDRKSNESVTVSVTVTMIGAVLEVMDAVRLSLKNWQDYSATGHINRSYEVQRRSIDWLNMEVELNLFGTTQKAPPLPAVSDAAPSPIDHTAWTPFESVLAPGTFENTGIALTLTGDNSLTGFANASTNGIVTEGWFFDGDVTFNASTVTACTGHFILEGNDITLNGDLDMRDGGPLAGTDNPYLALPAFIGGIQNCGLAAAYSRRYYGPDATESVFIGAAGTILPVPQRLFADIQPIINASGQLEGVPESLIGQPGVNSKPSFISETDVPGGISTYGEFGSIGIGGRSAGAVILICNNLFGEGLGNILVSGGDGQPAPSSFTRTFNVEPGEQVRGTLWASHGAGAYPSGVLVIKKNSDNIPDLNSLIVAEMGRSGFNDAAEVISDDEDNIQYGGVVVNKRLYRYTPATGQTAEHIADGTYSAGFEGVPEVFATAKSLVNGRRFNGFEVGRVVNLISNQGEEAQEGDEPPVIAPVVSNLVLTESPNTPRSEQGDESTITATITPPSDPNFDYAVFEIRTGSNPWERLKFKTATETTERVKSDGATYEIRARSMSKDGVLSEQSISAQITVANVTADPATSDGGQIDAPAELRVADISGLELVNRVGDTGAEALQFKSGNAEFAWSKSAVTIDGQSVSRDLHFAGYLVEVFRVETDDSTTKLRETTVIDSAFTYSFEQNRTDNCGRNFEISITAIARTGYRSPAETIRVSNPAPAAPSNITIESGFTGFKVRFDRPQDDVDFVGVDVFLAPGAGGDVYSEVTGEEFTGNNFSKDGLEPGTTYKLGLRARDQFGIGGQTTQISIVTNTVPGATVTEITGPVTINDAAGWLATNNAGYQMFLGAIDRPSISTNSLVLHSWNSIEQLSNFWVDAAGNSFWGGFVGIGSTAFGEAGIQLDPNGGSPRSYQGDGAEDYIKYETGVGVEIGRDTTLIGVQCFNNRKSFFRLLGKDLIENEVTGYTKRAAKLEWKPADRNMDASIHPEDLSSTSDRYNWSSSIRTQLVMDFNFFTTANEIHIGVGNSYSTVTGGVYIACRVHPTNSDLQVRMFCLRNHQISGGAPDAYYSDWVSVTDSFYQSDKLVFEFESIAGQSASVYWRPIEDPNLQLLGTTNNAASLPSGFWNSGILSGRLALQDGEPTGFPTVNFYHYAFCEL